MKLSIDSPSVRDDESPPGGHRIGERALMRSMRQKAAKEIPMIGAKHVVTAVVGVMLSAHLLSAQDLSRYRNFHLGTNLAAVATQSDTQLTDVKVIHQRPAVIQELNWRPRFNLSGSSVQMDSVEEMVFSFYNGELFRIVVTYDRDKVRGLTEKDLIEGISAAYGTATTPAVTISSAPFSQSYRADTDKVIARWEDGQYSLNLVRSAYGSTFSLVIFSRRLDALAQAAVSEAIRLDREQAPQREAERQRQQEADNRAAQEKARLVNKPAFRP